MTVDDDALARRAGAGDRDAFAALLDRHYDRIYRLALRLLGDADDAADLTQEICIDLAGKLKSWRGESRFGTWLYRVVVNAARDVMRRHTARRRATEGHAAASSVSRTAHGRQDGHEAHVWLHQALAALSDDLRETVLLVLQEGLSHAEAGAVLGVKESTISWRIHEARNRLRALAKTGGDGPS